MGTFGGGGGVLPVCGEVGGTAGRQRQPVAAGVPQTMLAPSSCLRGRSQERIVGEQRVRAGRRSG